MMDFKTDSKKYGKKGGMHTLEAMIAFITVLGFIAFVMPGIKSEPETVPVKNHAFAALGNLEKSGRLGALAMAENTSGIYSELNRTILLPAKFSVGLSRQSIYPGTLYPNESQPAYLNFTANTSTLDAATLELAYVNASGPDVFVNSQSAANHSGDYSGISETIDIKQHIITGQNSVMITAANNATISYRLRITESFEYGQRPEGRTISTVSYVVAGGKEGFRPSEIRVYIWRGES